ncbi:MAG: hypothetical protein WAU30_09490 [Propionicimonas sp.]
MNRSLPNRSLPNRSSPNRARRWVIEAIDHAWGEFPLPIAGIDSDNGSEFINHHFLHDCETRKITLRLGLHNQIRGPRRRARALLPAQQRPVHPEGLT